MAGLYSYENLLLVVSKGDVVYLPGMKVTRTFARYLWNREKIMRNQENLIKTLIYLSGLP